MTIGPWPAIALVVAGLIGMLALLRVLRNRFALHPELTRKMAHVGIGLASLSYPWLFRDRWPVVLLGGLAVVTLLSLRYVPALRRSVGGVVNGVSRSSAGDLYFPIAATGLFLLAKGDRVLYSIPILTLALADAVAALVGVFYGHFKYEGAEGKKSLEGSAAFFLVAFLATHVPLLLGTAVGRAESLLIGLTFGVLVMILEAVAWRGLDNLFIPFGGFLLLRAFLGLDAPALVARLVATLTMLGLVLALRRRRTLTDAAVLAGVLIGYVAWSVGGWRWLVPPLVLFLVYTLLWPRTAQVRERPHDVTAVLSVTGCGVLWLLLATVLERADLYYPYTLAFAANLVFIGINWLRDYRREPVWRAVTASAAVAWLVFMLPYVVVQHQSRPVLVQSALALVPLLLAGVAYVVAIPRRQRSDVEYEFPWTRQAMLSLGASALALGLL
ncbi:MAG TPA: hypothetical protein VEA99_10035 [Gemmatimonadaceae bacterium]|nr:hypothetical protein [Gemmatimonadaceae bacterium]